MSFLRRLANTMSSGDPRWPAKWEGSEMKKQTKLITKEELLKLPTDTFDKQCEGQVRDQLERLDCFLRAARDHNDNTVHLTMPSSMHSKTWDMLQVAIMDAGYNVTRAFKGSAPGDPEEDMLVVTF
jgi:hypothetical protein